jgi:hypothetical protein
MANTAMDLREGRRIMIVFLNRIFLGLIVIFSTSLLQIAAQVKPETVPAASRTEAQLAATQTNTLSPSAPACDGSDIRAAPPGVQSVTLSWNPSVPASAHPRDAVIGYIVYRSTTPRNTSAPPINTQRLTGTGCVDTQVQPGETYYYVARAVSASGALSSPSNEVAVRIPVSAPGSKQ